MKQEIDLENKELAALLSEAGDNNSQVLLRVTRLPNF
jgi:hypothetical protein